MFDGQHLAGDFSIPPVLDVVALILLAITGAVRAAKREYDWIGTVSIALVTGCGGGLVRDILLNVRPVILEHDSYLWAVVIAVFLTVYFCRALSKLRWIFLAADALGLAMYAVIGTQKALNAGLGVSAAILVGTLNAIGGGLIRDVITREEAALLKPGEWNAGIALGTSAVFGLMSRFTGLPWAVVGVVVVITAFVVRLLAARYNLQTRPLKPRGFDAEHWW